MKLIAGLGNPGDKYAFTRHNMGWLVIDHIVNINNLGWPSNKFNGGFWQWGDVILLKPTTFMNMSGVSVRAVINFYKIFLEDTLIVYDDAALPFGKLRLRAQGTAGGHKGLASVIATIGTMHVPRLRVGIGRPKEYAPGIPGNMMDFVLGRIDGDELEQLPEVMKRAETAIDAWLNKDIQKAMTIVNAEHEETPPA